VDFEQLKKKAKEIVDERGGVEALKEDANELKDIAEREGTLADKAKAAAAALKEAGAHHEGGAAPPASQRSDPQQ
jgi:hypothetical protein